MLEVIVVVTLVALIGFNVVYYLNRRKQLGEYKDLFEIADTLQNEAQAKVEDLLRAVNGKDLLLDRGAQALESSTEQVIAYTEEVSSLKAQVVFQETQYDNLLGQKKSSEVRTGKITEQIAPFLEDYPRNPRTARFIGDPIDFVHFDEDKVTFVEVKSGKSQLSKKQRGIRDLIKAGKVEFIIYRVEGK